MFKTNNNSDRLNYGKILTPPVGYVLEKAIGTTYSLDLETLIAVAIPLGLLEDTDSLLAKNSISLLNAFEKVSDKILVFCEAGQISVPKKQNPLNILVDKMVIPVTLPEIKKQKRYPAFHPKTWVIQYRNPSGERFYRFIVLSRNLTFDRSWDISLVLNSSENGSSEKTQPVVDFLEFLNQQIKRNMSDYSRKRSVLRNMMEELKDVSFSVEDNHFENFTIMPLGIGDKSYDMNSDSLIWRGPKQSVYSGEYTFHELVAFTPFLSASVIKHWNNSDRNMPSGTKRTLITRKAALAGLSEEDISNFRIFALKDTIVTGEEEVSKEGEDRKEQDIHAKIYLRVKHSNTSLYLGSMNASDSAIGFANTGDYKISSNIEMMVRLDTKKGYLSGESFLRELFCGDDVNNKDNPFEQVTLEDVSEESAIKDDTKLEKLLKDICRIRFEASLSESGESYTLTVKTTESIPSGDIRIVPLRIENTVSLSNEMVFENLNLLDLCEFFTITIFNDDKTEHISRVIMIPITGIPAERENAVVNSVVKDKKRFVEYVSFILGDDYVMSILEDKELKESGYFGNDYERLPALYEKMLRVSAEDPSRLSEVGRLLNIITDESIVPEEFRQLYDTFKKTYRLK